MNDTLMTMIRSLEAPSLRGFASTEYASSNRDHRTLVRTALAREVVKNHVGTLPMGLEKIGELSEVPRIKGWATSISHCPVMGGFVVGPAAFHIGLDFEISNRVTAGILGRVAPFPGEKQLIASLVNPARLWAAKEASIKAFGNLINADLNFALVEIKTMNTAGEFTATHRTFKAAGVATENGEVTVALAKTISS